MATRARTAAAIAMVVGITHVAGAQDAGPSRSVRLDLGYGPAVIDCSGCVGGTGAQAAFVQAATPVTEQVDIGVRGIFGWSTTAGSSRSVRHLLGVARIHPDPEGGFHFELGVGLLFLDATRNPPAGAPAGSTAASLSGSDLALFAGVGHDSSLGAHVKLTPFIGYVAAFGLPAANVSGSSSTTTTTSGMLHLGVSFGWH